MKVLVLSDGKNYDMKTEKSKGDGIKSGAKTDEVREEGRPDNDISGTMKYAIGMTLLVPRTSAGKYSECQ